MLKRSLASHPMAYTWQFRQAGTLEWMPAKVPGGVHTDLMTSGKLPDPFVANNEKRVQWVAETDWEYCTSVVVPAALMKEKNLPSVCSFG